MRLLFQKQLFRHGILVSAGPVDANHLLSIKFLLANRFSVRIVEGSELLTDGMVPFVAGELGQQVPGPFYSGFPRSVRRLAPNQLLFDQMFYYAKTYGLGMFDEEGHSVIEEYIEREAFKESCEPKNFIVLSEEDAIKKLSEYIESLVAGTRPLSDDQYEFVREYIRTYGYKIKQCASKNLAIRLMLDFIDQYYGKFLYLSDVIKVVTELNYRIHGRDNIKKLNLRNQERKFITSVINLMFQENRCDIKNCYEKKADWCGLLHHIHYKPINDTAAQFVQAMRRKENLSTYASFEEAMSYGDVKNAVLILKREKGNGAVLRNLTYMVSRCKSEEEVQFVCAQLEAKNGIVLLQLLMKLEGKQLVKQKRTFKFVKFNKVKTHVENGKEHTRRKSFLTPKQKNLLCSILREKIKILYANRLGKVYVDSEMDGIALPLQEGTSFSGYGTLPKGSRLHIPEHKKVRAFTYWERVNDIDLSCIGIDENGNTIEFSWRSMWSMQSEAITYSGDVTSGYRGGSEYFDVNLTLLKEMYPKMRYLLFCDNVYSGTHFSNCICRAGYMLRDSLDSGEIYEPKTVKTSFAINCESTFAYLFALDLETQDFIWLNVAGGMNARVAGTTNVLFLTDYFDVTSVMNLKSFMELCASELVDEVSQADVVVTDKQVEVGEGVEVIRSCDMERIMELMNV